MNEVDSRFETNSKKFINQLKNIFFALNMLCWNPRKVLFIERKVLWKLIGLLILQKSRINQICSFQGTEEKDAWYWVKDIYLRDFLQEFRFRVSIHHLVYFYCVLKWDPYRRYLRPISGLHHFKNRGRNLVMSVYRHF